jgi:ribosome-associated toxin RatA of RatAB toxin-antitoxin module
MVIKINDKPLDFTLSDEKTLGEILTGIEQWLSNSGHRLTEISVDGQAVGASIMDEIFKKDIKSVEHLDIRTSAIAELSAASLISLLKDIDEYENLSFDEKENFFDNWKENAQARFIMAEMPELYLYFENTFSNGDIAIPTLRTITEEVQREVNDPVNELANIEPVLNEICDKLIDIPLNIQTGKDLLAAQTIQLFSSVSEKIIRIFCQLNAQGYLLQAEKAKKIATDFSNFKNILTELLEAYEKHDTIIIGDLAEYEASPKLKELYFAVLENCRKTAEIQGEK